MVSIAAALSREEIRELSANEAEALGPNIQTLDTALTQFWARRFADDKLQRVYIVISSNRI